ncbi:MAG: cytochrome c4 [Gammaproteobacteria bacterium]|nr:MAG: cytochrome c4 [Gammaproteobacteria bacterium]
MKKIMIPTAMTESAITGKNKAAACASCHGADGNSLVTMYPKLAGQNAHYLIKQLKDFKDGSRKNAIMAGMAAALSEQDRIDIANYFAAQKTTKGNGKSNTLGKKLYFGGNVKRGIPACVACHGVNGKGMAKAGFPSLAGQSVEYLRNQLKLFHIGERANDKNGIMRGVTKKLKDKQADALAQFMSAL